MKKSEVKIGGHYVAKVSGRIAVVRIERESPFGGWTAQNVTTKRDVHVRGAQRLRYEVIRTDRGTWVKLSDTTPAERAGYAERDAAFHAFDCNDSNLEGG